LWDACLSDIILGKELGVAASRVKDEPAEYRVAAILNLTAQQLMQKTQHEKQKHEAAVARHSKH